MAENLPGLELFIRDRLLPGEVQNGIIAKTIGERRGTDVG